MTLKLEYLELSELFCGYLYDENTESDANDGELTG